MVHDAFKVFDREGEAMKRGAAMVAAVAAMVLAGVGAARGDDPVAAALVAGLEAAVASDATHFPGAILHVNGAEAGSHAVAAGVADITTHAPLTPDAAFRAGSIAKPFVAAVVLQLVEEGKLGLDQTMPELLPAEISGKFKGADRITLRMLLNHTSGIPEWLTEATIGRIAADPAKVWTDEEFIGIAAAEPPAFAPGEGWAYSNTDYNLLGLIIERATGDTWRKAVTERVIEPLGLAQTALPEPGDPSMPGAFMHGYGMIRGAVLDLSFIDPSMAGAAGGDALVTTAEDLDAFLTALRAGRLFKDPKTFAMMSDFVPAEGEGGRTGYGFGLERYTLPGGIEMIGHSGGTAGYRSGMFYFPALDLTMTFAISVQENPMPVILAGLKAMAPEMLK
jgi:D-alanyl-D-alanine carboxypeptidase